LPLVESPKATEPSKAEAAKAAPVKAESVKSEVKIETPKADAGKPAEKHGKAKVHHEHKGEKHEAKAEVKHEGKLVVAPVAAATK
jgi:hypothetical protein